MYLSNEINYKCFDYGFEISSSSSWISNRAVEVPRHFLFNVTLNEVEHKVKRILKKSNIWDNSRHFYPPSVQKLEQSKYMTNGLKSSLGHFRIQHGI